MATFYSFVSNYVQFDPKHVPKPGENSYCNYKGVAVNCGPRGLPPGVHSLYRNNGDGTFTDVSVQAGVSGLRGSYGMTVVAADFDEDGWPDIFIACDSTPSSSADEPAQWGPFAKKDLCAAWP